MIIQVPNAGGTKRHTIDTTDITKVDCGQIVMSPKGDGSGHAIGASVTTRSQGKLDVDPLYAGQIYNIVRQERGL
jgi:hypothetical protein